MQLYFKAGDFRNQMVFSFREIPDLKKTAEQKRGIFDVCPVYFLKIDLLIHVKAGQSDII